MIILNDEQEIKTHIPKMVKVLEKIDQNGCAVFRIDYEGRPMSLKGFSQSELTASESFCKSILQKYANPLKTDIFLWPKGIIKKEDDSFRYVMPVCPDEFSSFSKYLSARSKLQSISYRVLIDAALHITTGFMALHEAGYHYQYLNDSFIYINFETGDVFIDGNDYIMGYDYIPGVAWDLRYTAPEVIRGEGKMEPNAQTEQYSLAVILFRLLFINHPLEGKGTNPPCMNGELEKNFFGINPRFILNPSDESNKAIRQIHNITIKRWKQFPTYIKDTFIDAFGPERLHANEPYIKECEWLKLLIRLRNEIVTCSCGKEIFADPIESIECGSCGKAFAFPAYLRFEKINVPLYPSVRLYPFHTEEGSGDFRTPVAEVIVSKNNPGNIGLRNLSDLIWQVTGSDGKIIHKGKDEVIKIAGGLKIHFGSNVDAEIIGKCTN